MFYCSAKEKELDQDIKDIFLSGSDITGRFGDNTDGGYSGQSSASLDPDDDVLLQIIQGSASGGDSPAPADYNLNTLTQADVEKNTALVGDVEQHNGRRRARRAEPRQLPHLADRALRRARVEDQHVLLGRGERVGERREHRLGGGLRGGVAALHQHAEAGGVVDGLDVLAAHVLERLRQPRQLVALRVAHHLAARVGVERLTRLRVDDHERGDALHLEALGEGVLARVALRDREPRHLAVVLRELLRAAVRAHEDHLEALRLEVLLVRLDQLRRELAARRAPVRGEVEADVLAARLELVEVDGLAVHALQELAAEALPEARRLPREARAARVLADRVAPVGGDRLARLAVEDDEGRDALDLVLFRERRLPLALRKRQREPRLLAKVLLERLLVAVGAHEDHLEALGLEVLGVPAAEHGREL